MASNKNIVDKILESEDEKFVSISSSASRSKYDLRTSETAKKIIDQVKNSQNFSYGNSPQNSQSMNLKEKENLYFDKINNNKINNKSLVNNNTIPMKRNENFGEIKNEFRSKTDSSYLNNNNNINNNVVVKRNQSNNINNVKVKKESSLLKVINNKTLVHLLRDKQKTFTKQFSIKIIGVGGAGNNIVKYMAAEVKWPEYVEIIALNTDFVALNNLGNDLENIFILGSEELKGNGSGGDPAVGKKAAEDDIETIKQMLQNTDVLILVAGLGKGTGTGASPEIAKAANELGILTIGVFNLPSIGAEGNGTYANALNGLQELANVCNGLTTVNNDKIINLDREKTTIKKAYEGANMYIKTIVEEIIEIIIKPSDINVDFSDVKNFFRNNNGFLFSRVSIQDYSKDGIKNAIKTSIDNGFSEIQYKESEKALINFKLNENVPSLVLENTRNALKDLTKSGNINVVHGVSYTEDFENAEINILLTGTFEFAEQKEFINNSEKEIQNSDDENENETSVYETLKDTRKINNQNQKNFFENITTPISKNQMLNQSSSRYFDENDEDEFNFRKNNNRLNDNYYIHSRNMRNTDSYDFDDYRSSSHDKMYGYRDDYRNDRNQPRKEGFFSRLFKRKKNYRRNNNEY